MKTVHFCTTDSGGAFKAAYRINEAMKECGVDSRLCVRTRYHEYTGCEEVIDTPLKSLFSKAGNLGNLLLSKGEIITDAIGTDVSRLSSVKEADAVILHWVNSFISYSGVKSLCKTGKPVIWVMHDMWPYTGGCHYGYGCERYENGCGQCPIAGSKRRNDISSVNFRIKKKMFSMPNLTIVSPSRWNIECAKKSAVMTGLEKYVINNPIDKKIYHPGTNVSKLKRKLGLPEDKKIILFGAMGDSVHKWEGIRMIKEALEILPLSLRRELMLIVFGNGKGLDLTDFPADTRGLGFINGDRHLASLYAMADVFVSPSVADNYPNTLLEAICCGTPCVCFDIGGMGELVQTGKTGYLAKPKDVRDMSEGIAFVLESDLKARLSDPESNLFLTDNSYESIGMQYKKLCEKLIKNGKHK
ncbi:MAG: glycosyltransferase [Lachnospiraceae bacterium]|nr:glycosyltransferase [Lachnospiraceae bacterium]